MKLMPIKISSLLVIILALILSACGASSGNNSTIATAVALTVQAQNTQQAQFTPTSIAPVPSFLTPPTDQPTLAPPTAPPTSSSGSYTPCNSANFIQDTTIPDGTIEQPGAVFMKTWRVKNSGSCAWDSSYQLVFISGDIMGGGYVMNFPGYAAPGDTVDIPLQLTAPADNGTYTGFWKLQSPNKQIFGVGQYDQPLSVNIVVGSGTPANNKTATVYGVTSVTYSVARIPATGCPANVDYQTTAYITTNGPVTITYNWVQYDGNNSNNLTLNFLQADTKTVIRDFKVHLGSTNNPRWVQIVVTSPTYQEYGKSTFTYDCH